MLDEVIDRMVDNAFTAFTVSAKRKDVPLVARFQMV
jgi:hypothetical protein